MRDWHPQASGCGPGEKAAEIAEFACETLPKMERRNAGIFMYIPGTWFAARGPHGGKFEEFPGDPAATSHSLGIVHRLANCIVPSRYPGECIALRRNEEIIMP